MPNVANITWTLPGENHTAIHKSFLRAFGEGKEVVIRKLNKEEVGQVKTGKTSLKDKVIDKLLVSEENEDGSVSFSPHALSVVINEMIPSRTIYGAAQEASVFNESRLGYIYHLDEGSDSNPFSKEVIEASQGKMRDILNGIQLRLAEHCFDHNFAISNFKEIQETLVEWVKDDIKFIAGNWDTGLELRKADANLLIGLAELRQVKDKNGQFAGKRFVDNHEALCSAVIKDIHKNQETIKPYGFFVEDIHYYGNGKIFSDIAEIFKQDNENGLTQENQNSFTQAFWTNPNRLNYRENQTKECQINALLGASCLAGKTSDRIRKMSDLEGILDFFMDAENTIMLHALLKAAQIVDNRKKDNPLEQESVDILQKYHQLSREFGTALGFINRCVTFITAAGYYQNATRGAKKVFGGVLNQEQQEKIADILLRDDTSFEELMLIPSSSKLGDAIKFYHKHFDSLLDIATSNHGEVAMQIINQSLIEFSDPLDELSGFSPIVGVNKDNLELLEKHLPRVKQVVLKDQNEESILMQLLLVPMQKLGGDMAKFFHKHFDSMLDIADSDYGARILGTISLMLIKEGEEPEKLEIYKENLDFIEKNFPKIKEIALQDMGIDKISLINAVLETNMAGAQEFLADNLDKISKGEDLLQAYDLEEIQAKLAQLPKNSRDPEVNKKHLQKWLDSLYESL